MNPRNALRLAWIFSLSAARAKRAKGGEPGGLEKNPVTNIYMSLGAFALSAAFVYFVMGAKMEALTLEVLAFQLSVFLPAFTIFMSMVYSFMTEFSLSGETASTDMVNWLPIHAGDFVLGSALTTVYFVSPVISLLLGVSFGVSFLAGSLGIWALGALLGVLGCFLGAFVLEVVRGAMNRVSGAFSGAKGQGAVILRTLLSVTIIVAISMIFNITLMMRVVELFSKNMEGIRFVPIFWPSMIVLSQASGDPAGVLTYTGLSGILLFAVYSASVKVRIRNWAPAPVSLRLQPVKASRRRGLLNFMGLPLAEAALIRKDLRSLLRRKEMAYLLAIPIMIVLMGLMGTPPDVLLDASTPFYAKSSFMYQCVMAIVVLVFQTSLNAIGQEGEAFVNLMAAPLQATQILKAKFVAALAPALPVFMLFVAFFSHIAGTDAMSVAIMIVVGLATLVAVSSVELAVGARYAKFSGGGRALFVTQEGRLVGLLLCAATVGAASSPLALHFLWGRMSTPISLVLAMAVIIALATVGFKATRRELERLCDYDI